MRTFQCALVAGSFFVASAVEEIHGSPCQAEQRVAAERSLAICPGTSGESGSGCFGGNSACDEESKQLEWLAQISTRHADELRALEAAEVQARRDREILEWAAQISTRAADKLRALQRREAEQQDALERAERFYESCYANLNEWDEADHPREPKGTAKGGQFAPKDAGVPGSSTTGCGNPVVIGLPGRQTRNLRIKVQEQSHIYQPIIAETGSAAPKAMACFVTMTCRKISVQA